MKRSKGKGINAKAWFYSQSFVSSALGLPEPSAQLKQTVTDLKHALADLEKTPNTKEQEEAWIRRQAELEDGCDISAGSNRPSNPQNSTENNG